MPTIRVVAPAKINLALHVTGKRADGYHLLDSHVVFARDAHDTLEVCPAQDMELIVDGPFADGVPTDARNLCWRAAEAFGAPVSIRLTKALPHAAGIGGGSADAAAVLRAMEALFERRFTGDAALLGADVPVCLLSRSARMSGIGEIVAPVKSAEFHAVLVNPGVDVPTPNVFRALASRQNAPLADLPDDGVDLAWLKAQRNDLQAPAMACAPVIATCLDALKDAELARMSGSGATCFGLYSDGPAASAAAERLRTRHPNWWVTASVLR
ncbi:4-(cytidine 5'-diphospho)-2-C-methyl-D-erythritol kinase [Primorskyibacter sp. S187A]|uniref:4-(cytidine 5'-diphospho)-2-C-methyl-D-erythritol kinase n=1 Tax=Primorskyibacter sp. S187A TaxID=3415130 RepID=UPI003C7C5A6F